MPVQGMGRKKTEIEKQAVKDTKREFMEKAKQKDGFNFPLLMPGIIS